MVFKWSDHLKKAFKKLHLKPVFKWFFNGFKWFLNGFQVTPLKVTPLQVTPLKVTPLKVTPPWDNHQ